MSIEIAWLEQFTGMPLAEIPPEPEGQKGGKKSEPPQEAYAKAQANEAAYEKKRQQQALLLAQVRADLGPIKSKSRALLSTKIQAGPLKGKSFLKVEGEQIDEIDPDTLRMLAGGKKKLTINDLLPGDIGPQIALVIAAFDKQGSRLESAKFEHEGTSDDLFTAPEVQAEYWAPLRLERVYPDGLVLDKYSETQQMLDATNQLYLEMCEQKKIAGELTPEIDLVSELFGAGKDLASFGGEVLGAFAGGSDQVKLAKSILDSAGQVFVASDLIYQQAKSSDYAGAAAGAIDIAGKLTASIVTQFAGKNVGNAVAAGFSVGSSAVVMGKALARYRSGEGTLQDALNVMGDLVGSSLALAASQTTGSTAQGLATAAKVAPSALRAAGLASGPLVKAVREGDFPSVVKTLGEITKQVLSTLPGLEGQTDTLDAAIDLGAAAAAMAYKMAINVKRGDLLAAFNTAIVDISDNLGAVLALAGVPDTIAKSVIGAYEGSASASRALQMLVKDPGNVTGALVELTGGLDKALAGSGDPLLAEIGGGIKLAVEKMVSAKQIAGLYASGKTAEALAQLVAELGSGIEGVVKLAVPKSEGDGGEEEDEVEDEDEDEGEDDGANESGEGGGDEAPEQRKLKAKQRQAVSKSLAEMVLEMKSGKLKADPAKVQQVAQAMKAVREQQDAEDANEEARALLAQVELDLKALSNAEKAGAEASNIDNLIADLLRDRMILKIATQIAEGGADFLAQFVPALGAVSAGIKLAANLLAVAQRAQQLDAWINAQSDLKAAQSALSSSAANFVKNQGQQLAHYAAQAFFAAAQLAGKITELAGPAAPVGTIIAAVAGASAKAEEALLERKDKLDIEIAWKVTQKALRNPKNRQLGLEARKLNPSLAKFSIAWGAVVLKDPLARDAMRACGLNEASLKNDNTDVNKVVQYLEAFYEDDKALYRDSTEPVPEWVPKDPEVTLKWWSQLRLAAAKTPKLQMKNAGLLEGLLGELMSVEETADQTSDAVTHEKELFVALRAVMDTAVATMGVNDAVLEPPSIDDIVLAIDAHHAMVVKQYALLTQIASAYKACAVEPLAPGRTPPDKDPNVKELQAVLRQLQAYADGSAKVAEAEAKGVVTSKLALQTSVEELRRKAAMKVQSLKVPEKTV